MSAPLLAAAQDFSSLVIEKFASGFEYTDGPVWTKDGELIVSDTTANHLLRMKPGSKPETMREDSGGAAGNAIDSQGRLYTCEARNRRVVRIGKKGDLEVVAERFQGKRLNAPNDIAVRRDGHVYFTDPAFGSQQDTRELDFYGVFHVQPNGELDVVARPEGRPNGIALSPDGKKLYVSNSDERNIRVYDLDRKGVASNGRIFADHISGVPNGLRTDEAGNVYLAANHVLIYSPGGQLIHEITVETPPSNLAFGEDLQSLFITDRSIIYRIRMPVKGWMPYSSQ